MPTRLRLSNPVWYNDRAGVRTVFPKRVTRTMATDEWIDEAQRYLMATYAHVRFPLVLVKGRGARVYDKAGREYLDFGAGVAVTNLGHCHPHVTVAIRKQAQRLLHTSNLYYNEPQIRLAKALVTHSFADKVFFCNSGAEANEAAIKLARKFARTSGPPDRYEIITTLGAFHGRTMGTISASGQPKLHAGFEPLLPGFAWVPFDDLAAVEKAINEKTVAVLVEPVQGEGGVRVPRSDYLAGLRKLCNERGLLLILDEVQTGLGRTGKLFAYEHAGVTPDVITLAKGLANGVSIGAMLATNRVAAAFTPGAHGSTQGGNPLACAAALATLAIIEEERLMENAVKTGDFIRAELAKRVGGLKGVKEIRGKGLMIGIELDYACGELVQQALERGVLINVTVDNVIRLLPPLNFKPEEAELLLATLAPLITEFLDRQSAQQAAAQPA